MYFAANAELLRTSALIGDVVVETTLLSKLKVATPRKYKQETDEGRKGAETYLLPGSWDYMRRFEIWRTRAYHRTGKRHLVCEAPNKRCIRGRGRPGDS